MPGGRRLSKADDLFEVLGALDQTSATLGLAISFMEKPSELVEQLHEIQRNFLAIGATVAAADPTKMPILNKLPQLTLKLEHQIDLWDAALPELKNFIVAGGSSGGAAIHQARTLIRQAERNYHRLSEIQKIEEISVYLNRLSDYFFQAARFYNFSQNEPEAIWKLLDN